MTTSIRRSSALAASLLALTLTASSAAVAADNWSGGVNIMLGAKGLDDNDWGVNDSQGAIGVMTHFKRNDWPVSIAIDVYGAGDTDGSGTNKREGYTGGLHAGVRKIWDFEGKNIHPFISGGIASIGAEQRRGDGASQVKQDDSAVGLWVSGGAYWTLGDMWNIGLETRYTQAEVTLFGQDVEAGGVYTGLLLGLNW